MKITNDKLDCRQMESPNQSGSLKNPTLLVLHYTASGDNKDGDAKYFQRRNAQASAHLVIERDGSVVQCVPFDKKAWHAGKSSWKGVNGCNSFSIGIEIDNWGLLTKRENGEYYSHTGTKVSSDKVISAKNKLGNPGYWEVYPEAQLNAVERIVKVILETYPSITEIVGHEDISPRRKIDPGPALYEFMRKLNNKMFNDRRDDTKCENKIKTVTARSLNVRAGPSSNHDIIGGLSKGDGVEVLYDAGSWSQIKTLEIEGWVYDKYLS